jgi:hypothetical protein
MVEFLLTRTPASPPGPRQDKLVRVQVQGFGRHTGIYESCRLGCVINEELLKEEATSLLIDNQTTMLATALFNTREKPEVCSFFLHITRYLARNRHRAQRVMRQFVKYSITAYFKQEGTECLGS